MNIIRFREKVKLLSGKVLSKPIADKLLDSPLFLFGNLEPLSDLEFEWCKQHVLDESGRVTTHLPFPVFSALYKISDHEESGITDTALLVWGLNQNIEHGYDYLTGRSVSNLGIKLALTVLLRVDKHEAAIDCGYTGQKMTINTFMDGKETTEQVMSNRDRSDASVEIAHGARNVLLKIVFDIMNPANVVLKVTPKQNDKSVTWVKAHTHYCIINKSQAQRCMKDGRGPSDHEIERAAHWRRAHMRRLMSDKFTHKKGQLVFVKQSWVGPEEWEGTDRKTYKVIHINQTK